MLQNLEYDITADASKSSHVLAYQQAGQSDTAVAQVRIGKTKVELDGRVT